MSMPPWMDDVYRDHRCELHADRYDDDGEPVYGPCLTDTQVAELTKLFERELERMKERAPSKPAAPVEELVDRGNGLGED